MSEELFAANPTTQAMWLAKQEICELQRLYAKATDLLCLNAPDGSDEARQIYHRIFTPDAVIRASGVEPQIGPDAWVELVVSALEEFDVTQHFIGTQLANVSQLPNGSNAAGAGHLMSHLQAWHVRPDGYLWHFIGTYDSQVVHTAGGGWQICDMTLSEVSQDYRRLQPRDG